MKLGPHVEDWRKLDLRKLIDKMRPPLLKTLMPGPELTTYANEVQEAVIIARSYVPHLQSQLGTTPPDTLAHLMRDKLLSDWKANLEDVNFFELFNETGQTGDGLKHLTDFTVEACRLMQNEGHAVAVGSFSVGNPAKLPDDWFTFRPAVEVADAIALHEYGAPALWSQPGVETPHYRNAASDAGWWALRYRRARTIINGYGLPNQTPKWKSGNWPPFIITECGIDLGAIGQGRRGWRSAGITARQYVDQLAWYDCQLSLDHYVIGATVFSYGSTPDWRDYDLAGVEPFEEYVAGGSCQNGLR